MWVVWMRKEYFKNNWRKLDNVAKVFSMDDESNTNTFRYSVILKQNVNKNILKKALDKSLERFKSFKVKFGTGLFWNYLEYNSKEAIVTKEDDIPCQHIKLKRNNNYLFKISYYKNKINLDIFHVLTDGVGASKFLKSIVYNYLNLKHKLKNNEKEENNIISYSDQYLKNYDPNIKFKVDFKMAYQIPGRVHMNTNNTYHYIVDINNIKNVCKSYGATITEYLTAVYIYAIYLSLYKKKTSKEIVIKIPIDLRKHYQVDTLSNFFVCSNINSKIKEKKLTTFKGILNQVKCEFKEKINKEKIREYLSRDVTVGKNVLIRTIPLPIKKIAMKLIFNIASMTSSSTLSNVGIIDIDNKYKKYIDNILVLVMPGKKEKLKCTICSYDTKLNITINSNIDDTKFERTFLSILKQEIENIKLESNRNLIK